VYADVSRVGFVPGCCSCKRTAAAAAASVPRPMPRPGGPAVAPLYACGGKQGVNLRAGQPAGRQLAHEVALEVSPEWLGTPWIGEVGLQCISLHTFLGRRMGLASGITATWSRYLGAQCMATHGRWLGRTMSAQGSSTCCPGNVSLCCA
jgi:hypothetical protein